ncbi:MAG: type II toxin-antitoxin system HicA family toxin [Chloroflexota bacterium]|nr:type II toxin-antitoxin system HicA family toxin [Chloroflexota bacterium]
MYLRTRHRRTLERIFARPTPSDIRWAEVVSLLRALDVEISQRAGSRVRIGKDGVRIVVHEPHPNPYLDRRAVRDIATFLTAIGVAP